jgi:hypothetical protein
MRTLRLTHVHSVAFGPHGAAATAGSAIEIALTALVVLVVALGVTLFIIRGTPRTGRSDDDDADSGGGGRGPGVPPGPGGPPPQPERGPTWWPEFEQQFAGYVEHARRAAPVVVSAPVD